MAKKTAKSIAPQDPTAPHAGDARGQPKAEKQTLKAIVVKKAEDFSAWYTELISKAELADIRYGVKGFVVYMPWATITIKKMYQKYETLLEANGHLPLVMPTLIPESYFYKEADHVEGFAPEVFWVETAGSKGEKLEERLALRPTSETALYSMYSLWIRSYQDLPFKRYQSCQVFRHEGKATRPFFRGREFHWIEAHNVFATLEEARAQVLEDMEMTYKMVRDEFCMPVIFFERPQWDKFAGAISTYAADALLESGRVIQLPSTHLLGQNFSKPFNVQYMSKDGTSEYGYITCYGPAISRIYGAMIAMLGDDQGLVLPFDLAPVQVVIVPIYFKGKVDAVEARCKAVAATLRDVTGFSIKLDDRDYVTAGEKFNEWELRGVPIRIEIGPKDVEKDQAVLVTRYPREKRFVPATGLVDTVKEIAAGYTAKIKERHLQRFETFVERCETIDEAKQAIDHGKIAAIGLCSIGMEGYECAEYIEKNSGGLVRGKRVDEEPVTFTFCAVCGKRDPATVYVARSY